MRDELQRLPRSLDEIYSLILDKISHMEKLGRTVAEMTLKWLLCAKDARSMITRAACTAASSIKSSGLSIQNILDVCSNFVSYDIETDTFGFAHLSVREFLESKPGYGRSEVNIFILEQLIKEGLGQESVAGCLGYRTWRCLVPGLLLFKSYASLYWAYHYSVLEEQNRKTVFECHIGRFLFDGKNHSEDYNKWTADLYCCGVDWTTLVSRNGVGFKEKKDEDTYSSIIVSALNLACYFGWLEVVDYFESIHGLETVRDNAMSQAVQGDQLLMVERLLIRSVWPTDWHIILALWLEHSSIVKAFVKAGAVSVIPNGDSLQVTFTSSKRQMHLRPSTNWGLRKSSVFLESLQWVKDSSK